MKKKQGNSITETNIQSITYKAIQTGLFICCFVAFTAQNLLAQTATSQKANTVITGVFKGDLRKTIRLTVDRSYINSDVKTLEVPIKNDSFRFEFYLDVAQKVTLKYLRNTGDVYVEPGDHLHIDGEASSFYYSFKFSGNSAENNEFLRKFAQKHPIHYNKYKFFTYKKGIIWYKVHRDLDPDMRKYGPEDYKTIIDGKRDEMMLTLNSFDESFDKLTADFKLYMWAEINYYWAYNLLAYGYAFGQSHKIDFQDFFGFMYEIPLQNDKALGSQYYRDFVVGAINYYCEGHKKIPNPDDKIEDLILKQYKYGEKELTGKPQAFYLTEMLKMAFAKQAISKMMDTYNAFFVNNKYPEFNRKIR